MYAYVHVYVCSTICVEQMPSKNMQLPLGTWYLPQSHKKKYTLLSEEDNRKDAHEITE